MPSTFPLTLQDGQLPLQQFLQQLDREVGLIHAPHFGQEDRDVGLVEAGCGENVDDSFREACVEGGERLGSPRGM